MFSAISKSILAGTVAMMLATACTDSEKQGATELYTQSEAAINEHNYAGALTLLDTLNSRYPRQTEIRREALRLRAMAMEGVAVDSISAGDQALAEATLALEAIRPSFRHVDSSVGLEGYFLPQKVSEKVMTATGIQPRVSDKGFFYIVANVQGKSIGLQSIAFYDGGECVASSDLSPVRIIRVEGSESASFNPEELEGVGQWLENHPGTSKVELCGTKGKVSVKMTKDLYNQLVECYRFSNALQAQRLASIKREKYERMLATARDQLANLPIAEKK